MGALGRSAARAERAIKTGKAEWRPFVTKRWRCKVVAMDESEVLDFASNPRTQANEQGQAVVKSLLKRKEISRRPTCTDNALRQSGERSRDFVKAVRSSCLSCFRALCKSRAVLVLCSSSRVGVLVKASEGGVWFLLPSTRKRKRPTLR